jgi:hypothetical protein
MLLNFSSAVILLSSTHTFVSEDLVGTALLKLQQDHNINRQQLFLQTK